jgi:magnesium-transporting ATPase (P-type)
LMKLQPKIAYVIRNGREEEIPADEVEIDDLITVRPGEAIAVDGAVVEGYSGLMLVDKKSSSVILEFLLKETKHAGGRCNDKRL